MLVRALRGGVERCFKKDGAVQSSEHCHMFLLITGALESNEADKTDSCARVLSEQWMAFCGC